MDTQRHKPLTPRKPQALSALDNHFDLLNQRSLSRQSSLQDENGFSYKSMQPIKPVTTPSMTWDDKIQKENRPPVLIQRMQTPPSSGHCHAGYSSYNRTTNTIDPHIRRAVPLKLESPRSRPTTGGKTISASLMDRVNQSYHDNGDHQRGNHNDTNHHRARNRPRTEQRMSQEQLKLLSRRIDTSLPNSPHGSPSKPVLPSIFSNGSDYEKPKSSLSSSSSSCRLASFSSSLYQTCIDLWPSEPTLGDFASENIKNLTDLLKVRLSQAKYRILAQLEDEERQESQGMACKKMYPAISTSAGVLRDDIDYSTWPTFEKHRIELSSRRSRSFPCVSGNGSNLFRHREAYLQRQRTSQQHKRQQQKHHRQHLQQIDSAASAMMNYGSPEKRSAVSLPPPALNNMKKDMKRKRRAKPKTEVKSPRNDGRIQASLVSPVVSEDGTRAYVCTPCSKKYKTRNGLAYHFNRCPQQPKQESAHMMTMTAPMDDELQGEQSIINEQQLETSFVPTRSSPTGSKSSGVHCVCDHPTDDEKMMVQCDECQLWLHLDCVGANDAILDDIYHCPRCTDRLMKRPRLNQQPHDMANLIFQQLNDNVPTNPLTYPLQPTSSQPSISSSQKQQQQQPIWDDFDVVETAPSTTTSAAAVVAVANTSTTTSMPMTPATAAIAPNTSNDVNNNNNSNSNLWGMSTADIPSLLYSDATAMTSTLDDDLPYLMDLPSSELSPHDLPPTDWFQFANFDDDFHCDDSQATQ
ncbi:hypothetical protein BCR42DRAFT_451835 [Absidia repens]|uniref:PHD-type domain-containing protein n=1 Tax=Absidia repens TaxID=90262 RepID=A0A1X2IGI3_9FUNG|nr:hypothetical protein BCR42DRAFT_451835 [Absidia repens]